MAFDPHYRFVRSIVADTDGPDQELATDFKVERIEPDPNEQIVAPYLQGFCDLKGSGRRKNHRDLDSGRLTEWLVLFLDMC